MLTSWRTITVDADTKLARNIRTGPQQKLNAFMPIDGLLLD